MRLQNLSQYPDDEVRKLVEFGMKGVGTTGVYVKVKNAKSKDYRGMAYYGTPSDSPTSKMKTVRNLVTIGIGNPDCFPCDNLCDVFGPYELCAVTGAMVSKPIGKQPYGGKRSPHIVMNDWREALICVAAHEARHIYQFRHNKRRSEVDAEKFAAKRLAAYRHSLLKEAA